ncbi:MAG: Gfo/Idh/MocA family oxidoreductase [Acidobacteria bacterium]|nr:Gfo/Idh/MocA family oxidoreductase [Acidobacteriota bacterium]MCL5744960.1 Gfo/Idh/MocA family oxidoreductase [Acidobacteriota bacterium]
MPRTERRGFLKGSAAGVLLLKPETVFGSQANSALEVGIIGCGGRGNFIAGLFMEHTGSRIVALADPFRDRMEATVRNLKLTAVPRQYAGLNGYRELLASRPDAVAILSPPYFHPEQAEAALSAGRHIYLAKPVAVDVPGCRSIAQTGEKAKGRVSFLVDWQSRVRPVFQEAVARVHNGAIGKLVFGQVYFHTGRLTPKSKPGMPAGEARLRDWVFDKVLSGDIIVEQAVHCLDAGNWYARAHPLKARGTGGREARVDVGDCWDHFMAHYWYPGSLKVDFSCEQFAKGFGDYCIRMYGSKGVADSHHAGVVNILGENPWKGTGTEKDPTSLQGPVTNVKNFVESIRAGKLLNNIAPSVESTLTAILGRMACYREDTVTWDEMMRSNEKLSAALQI